KARYGRELSRAIESGDLDIDGLAAMDGDNVRTQLMRVKGIGRWTADIYLLMALLRPDVWPTGDLALVKAMQKVKGMPAAPTADEASDVAASWRPWRAVAARILWHYYLSTR
ncbi:MAG: DNA-3-methyladenine glycosylase 2 family protein, partial [Anaerolineae bacterium]|nr:DNA-3-methyladenine glycosylase 2 family protein [Anaerolineae bacterium]